VAVAPTRLPAAERRHHLVETAIRVFSEGSYPGTTTAEIAKAAGVSEPILYRHFASKRDRRAANATGEVPQVRGLFPGAGGRVLMRLHGRPPMELRGNCGRGRE
jgi:Bacterial regulatory proteins, tetR family